MKKIYYTIWADCLGKMKSNPKNGDNWKTYSMLVMTIIGVFNLMFIMAIIQKHFFNSSFYDLSITYFKYNNLNILCKLLLLYVVPVFTINYFFVLYEKKYKQIMECYKYHGGRWFFCYMLVSLFFPFLVLVSGLIYVKFFN